jgi:AraC family transcriptional regulator
VLLEARLHAHKVVSRRRPHSATSALRACDVIKATIFEHFEKREGSRAQQHSPAHDGRVILILYENEVLSTFLHDLSAQGNVNEMSNQKILTIGNHSGRRGDLAEFRHSRHHHLSITEGYLARWHDGRRSYAKQPGTFSFVPVGVIPHMQAETPYKVLVCLIDPLLLNGVMSDLDQYSSGELQFRINSHDPALRQLVRLLYADTTAAGLGEQLYREHLTYAIALRVLSLNATRATGARFYSPLPARALRRVIERMDESGNKVTLEELARISGYSRNHFLRMFQAATGRTPHNYVMHRRLERAQGLIKKQSLPLIHVALACGYSSHSHMTQVFRKHLGVTPSEYQRQVFSHSK